MTAMLLGNVIDWCKTGFEVQVWSLVVSSGGCQQEDRSVIATNVLIAISSMGQY